MTTRENSRVAEKQGKARQDPWQKEELSISRRGKMREKIAARLFINVLYRRRPSSPGR